MKIKVYKYFNTKINEDNIVSIYEEVDIHYKNEFFELFSNCIEAVNVSNVKMSELLQCEKIRIRDILEYKSLVIFCIYIMFSLYFHFNFWINISV